MGYLLGFCDSLMESYKIFIYLLLNVVYTQKREQDDDDYHHISIMACNKIPILNTVTFCYRLAIVWKNAVVCEPRTQLFSRLVFKRNIEAHNNRESLWIHDAMMM